MANVPFEPLRLSQKTLVFVYVSVAVTYLVWRLGTFNPDAMAFSALVYGAEVYGFGTMLLHLFMNWRLTARQPPPPEENVTVDVFVPTLNEPVDVVRRTLIAARGMDYPHQTWLLDDGNRPEMRALARRLGCLYLARSENTDAKAGNLNNALAHSAADFVAVFDADHAPHRDFLLRTLGYFRDRGVAFVQTPQDFYNLDSYQHRVNRRTRHVWAEQSLFFRVILRGKDHWNAAFFCGSCGVVRRQCLDEVGGFATGTVTEDLHTSIRLHARGYRSVYHAESLAFGIAALEADGYLRQRLRWGQGAMQVWRREGVLFNRNLTIPQRLNYFASIVTYFDGWQRAVLYSIPAIALVFGVIPIGVDIAQFLVFFVPYIVLTFWTLEETTRGYGNSFFIEQYNIARFATFCRATFGMFLKRLSFDVTGKRRNIRKRKLVPMGPQVLLFSLNLFAIPIGIYLYLEQGQLPFAALVANVFWASALALIAIFLLAFTVRNSFHRRHDYRFPVPLCATVAVDGGQSELMIVDDLSSSSLRLHGLMPAGLQTGDLLTGDLSLPDGPLYFNARIKRLTPAWPGEERSSRTAGCQVEFLQQEDIDRLEAFLHGNEIQWHVQGIGDRMLTPLNRFYDRRKSPVLSLANDRRRTEARREMATVQYWAPCLYRDRIQHQSVYRHGVISGNSGAEGQPRYLMVTSPLICGGTVEVVPVTYRGDERIGGAVASETSLTTGDGVVYIYKLDECAEVPAWELETANA